MNLVATLALAVITWLLLLIVLLAVMYDSKHRSFAAKAVAHAAAFTALLTTLGLCYSSGSFALQFLVETISTH